MLTDLQHRVWTQYLLSADDFGIMHATAVKLQADNLSLSRRPVKVIARCLEALIVCGLLRVFEHQGERYVYSYNWQQWQKIEYPRQTDTPPLPLDALEQCDDSTRALMMKHPGGQRKDRRRPDDDQSYLGRASQRDSEGIPPTRAGAPAKRLTANANGVRLTAHGSEGGPGETAPPMDVWARELVGRYPAQGRCGWNLVERPLFAALTSDPTLTPEQAWVWLQARLEQHAGSHQWRVKGMIPRLDKWLREGMYLQELPSEAPVAERVAPKTSRTLAAAAEIMREGAQ